MEIFYAYVFFALILAYGGDNKIQWIAFALSLVGIETWDIYQAIISLPTCLDFLRFHNPMN